MILDAILGRIKWWCSKSLKHWKISPMQPIVKIQETGHTIITRGITLSDQDGNKIPFFANRITVSNSGRSAARDCKVYIEFAQNNIERTAWTLPNNNTTISLTLSVGIPQYVDLCAITKDGYFRRVINEHSLNELKVASTSSLPGPQDVPAIIRVTSSNAKPAERKVIFHSNFIPDENNPGRIVEFP